MRSHEEIDRRSLELARAVVAILDADPERAELTKARERCVRWARESPSPAIAEWREILAREWGEIRTRLLDESEEGRRLRQSSPFSGVLSPRQRWEILRRFGHESPAA